MGWGRDPIEAVYDLCEGTWGTRPGVQWQVVGQLPPLPGPEMVLQRARYRLDGASALDASASLERQGRA